MPPAFPAAALPVALLAHQGGWDEIGLVAIPLVIVGALLILANRRAKHMLSMRAPSVDPESGSPAEHPSPAE